MEDPLPQLIKNILVWTMPYLNLLSFGVGLNTPKLSTLGIVACIDISRKPPHNTLDPSLILNKSIQASQPIHNLWLETHQKAPETVITIASNANLAATMFPCLTASTPSSPKMPQLLLRLVVAAEIQIHLGAPATHGEARCLSAGCWRERVRG